MTREEAITLFEKQLTAAQVVLDSGFGSNPGENDILYRRRKEMAEIALSALRSVSREQVEKVRHGRWIKHEGYDECSECHAKSIFGYNYCHNCGARMDKEAEQWGWLMQRGNLCLTHYPPSTPCLWSGVGSASMAKRVKFPLIVMGKLLFVNVRT